MFRLALLVLVILALASYCQSASIFERNNEVSVEDPYGGGKPKGGGGGGSKPKGGGSKPKTTPKKPTHKPKTTKPKTTKPKTTKPKTTPKKPATKPKAPHTVKTPAPVQSSYAPPNNFGVVFDQATLDNWCSHSCADENNSASCENIIVWGVECDTECCQDYRINN